MAWSGSLTFKSCLSDNSPCSAYKSTGGRSDTSLSVAELTLEKLSCLCSAGEPVSVATEGLGRSECGLLVETCLVAEGSIPGRFWCE